MTTVTQEGNYTTVTGGGYQEVRDLPMAEIAKRIRANIKALRPEREVRVRKRNGAIDAYIVITEEEEQFLWTTEGGDLLRRLRMGWTEEDAPEWMVKLVALEQAVEERRAFYNKRTTDPYTDYYNTNYWGGTRFVTPQWLKA